MNRCRAPLRSRSVNTCYRSLAGGEQLMPYTPGDLGEVGNRMDVLAICGGYADMPRLGVGATLGALDTFDSSMGIRDAASRTGNVEQAWNRADQDLPPDVVLFMRKLRLAQSDRNTRAQFCQAAMQFLRRSSHRSSTCELRATILPRALMHRAGWPFVLTTVRSSTQLQSTAHCISPHQRSRDSRRCLFRSLSECDGEQAASRH